MTGRQFGLALFGVALLSSCATAPKNPSPVQYHAQSLAQPKGKILVVMTNHADYPSRHDKTGLWVTELTHFFEVADKAGFAMDFIGPKGGAVPLDERSLKPLYMDKQAHAYLADTAFWQRLQHTKKPSDVQASDYQAIYFTGGHGVMWDFVDNAELTALAEGIYAQGGIVSAVCHGVAGLLSLKDTTGKPLIADKKVTGFSNLEESLSGVKSQVPFLLQDELTAKGACYLKGLVPFTSYVVVDGRIITGQNPQSPRAVGKKVIEQLTANTIR